MNTNNKIKQLTDKIYLEGIDEAKKEADLIIEKAKKEAEELIESAKRKEKEITEEVQKKAEELKKNTDSELRLAARQFVSTLKQEISKDVVSAQVESPVKEAFNDTEFVKNLILSVINKWDPKSSEGLNLNLLLPEAEEKELSGFFQSKVKDLLNAGLEINFIPTIKKGFKVEPTGSSYHINFTDEGFENYFKHYLKDKTKKMIFD